MINFTGNLIHYTDVLKRNHGNNYSKQKVAFVELDMSSSYDKKFINNITDSWRYYTDYVDVMNVNFDYYYDNPEAPKPPRIFALTRQTDNFDNLDYTKALGLVQTSDGLNNNIDIELLQTNPEYINFDRNTDIKYIGTTILDSLKEYFNGKKLTLYSVMEAIPFYQKNKFKPANARDNGRNLFYQA